MIKNLRVFYLLLLGFIPFYLEAQALEEKISALDTYINYAKEQWDVPGLAVAVVKDRQNLLLKGYGDKQIGLTAGVDTSTLFAICSTTKAMTSAAMCMLVDQGRIEWDDPVIEYLPEFQLHDPYITRSIRIRDLFTHNTGIGNADLLWYLWNHDPETILYKIRFLEASYPLRGGYTYQNIMYAAAGRIIAKLSGMSWEDFVSTRIFKPLGMQNTFANQERSITYKNRSIAHHRIQGEIRSIPDGSADLIGPAGAIWSTIADMSKWMKFVLDSAKINGVRLISPKNYREWLKPQAIVSDAGFYPTQKLTKPHWKTYGLGWFQHDYHGRVVNFHTGSLQGTVAMIGLITQENLGVYIFGNLDHAEVRHAIMYKVFDLFGQEDPGVDWSSKFKELYAKEKPKSDQGKIVGPPHSLEKYIGLYQDEYLGSLSVDLVDGELIATIGSQEKLKLKPNYLNKFKAHFIDRPWRDAVTLHFEELGDGPNRLYFFKRKFIRVETDE